MVTYSFLLLMPLFYGSIWIFIEHKKVCVRRYCTVLLKMVIDLLSQIDFTEIFIVAIYFSSSAMVECFHNSSFIIVGAQISSHIH